MQEQKTALRRQFRQIRDHIAAPARICFDHAILRQLRGLPEVINAVGVFSYVSSGAETDTHMLLEWLLSEGKRVTVPRITGSGLMQAVPFTAWSELEIGPRGILSPTTADSPATDIDVCITPGVAFTPNGVRLGQGLGYYDRWFAAHRVSHRIALAYECQITDNLPTDVHDAIMDIIVTEQRVIRVS